METLFFLILNIQKLKQTKKVADFIKNFWDFQDLMNIDFFWRQNFGILLSMNIPWGHVSSHTKFEPDRLSRFDFYWIQTATDNQTSN